MTKLNLISNILSNFIGCLLTLLILNWQICLSIFLALVLLNTGFYLLFKDTDNENKNINEPIDQLKKIK